MADADKAKAEPEEAKGAVASFIQTVGIIEIFLGGVALYLLFVVRPDLFSSFKKVGLEFADNALLVCAAAVAGKLAHLLACLPLAALPPYKTANAAFKGAIQHYEQAHAVHAAVTTLDEIDRARVYLENRAPGVAERLSRVRDAALICYGAAVLGIPVILAKFNGWTIGFVLALFFLGWLHACDYRRSLAIALVAPLPPKQP